MSYIEHLISACYFDTGMTGNLVSFAGFNTFIYPFSSFNILDHPVCDNSTLQNTTVK